MQSQTPFQPTDPKESSSSTARLRDQAATVRDDLRELGEAARDVAQEKLHEAGRATSQYVGVKREQMHEMEDHLVEYVRSKPLQSVLMAAGVGVVLGMCFSRN